MGSDSYTVILLTDAGPAAIVALMFFMVAMRLARQIAPTSVPTPPMGGSTTPRILRNHAHKVDRLTFFNTWVMIIV